MQENVIIMETSIRKIMKPIILKLILRATIKTRSAKKMFDLSVWQPTSSLRVQNHSKTSVKEFNFILHSYFFK